MATELKDHTDEAGVHWNDTSKQLEIKAGGVTPNSLSFAVTAAAQTVLDDATVTAMLATLGGARKIAEDFAVAFSATPTFDISAHESFVFGQITADFAPTLSNPAVGQSGVIALVQDGTGGWKMTGLTVTGFTVIMLAGSGTTINSTEFKAASARSVFSYKLCSVNSVNICFIRMEGGKAAAFG